MARRILIVDDIATNRIVLKAKLTAAGYAVDVVADLDGTRAAIQNRLPDAALISATLREEGAHYLPRLLNSRAGTHRVPVVMLNGGITPVAPSPFIDAVLPMPGNDSFLLARLRSAIRVRDLEDELNLRAKTCQELGMAEDPATYAAQPHILLVPRSQNTGTALADKLNYGSKVKVSVLPIAELRDRLEERGKADVVILDADKENPTSDLSLLADLRCRTETRHASIIMRLPDLAETEAGMALDLGASDVTVGQTDAETLRAMIDRQIARQEQLAKLRAQVQDGLRLAAVDPLTGLYNRRYALTHLQRLVQRSAETGRALAVMVLDIDRFKQVNDRHGHQTGDRVIRAVARTLSDNLRNTDMLARHGGEEFLITMPDTSVDEASHAAERLCRKIAALRVIIDDAQIGVTLSIGLAVRASPEQPAPEFAETLIHEADRALYDAKNDGRNQVILSQSAA